MRDWWLMVDGGFVVDLVDLDGSTVLVARGEIDAASAPVLRSALEQAKSRDPIIAVDLAGVTFMDSSGLNVLVLAQRSLDGIGSVRVTNPSQQVRRLLEMTGLDHLINRDSGAAFDSARSDSDRNR